MASLDEVLRGEIDRLDQAGLRRTMRRWRGAQGPWLELDGRQVLGFSSNNTLDLAGHPDLREAARSALEDSGVGAGSARLVCGNHEQHEALEHELARWHRREAALLFNSGFQANTGVVAALVGAEDAVISDELNHASLIDGCRSSRARVLVYRHGDAADAREKLAAVRGSVRRALVVTESLFSMDGDVAPLAELRRVADDLEAWLLVDEAHALGAVGPEGQGAAADAGVVPDILIGTLGKAFGSFGAYAAGSAALRDHLVHRARTFVFTTALPPSVVAASRAALHLIAGPDGIERRAALARNVDRLTAALGGPSRSHIQPFILGDERTTMRAAAALLDQGLYVSGIRPPTVPRGTSRLRISLMSAHQDADIERLTTALRAPMFHVERR